MIASPTVVGMTGERSAAAIVHLCLTAGRVTGWSVAADAFFHPAFLSSLHLRYTSVATANGSPARAAGNRHAQETGAWPPSTNRTGRGGASG